MAKIIANTLSDEDIDAIVGGEETEATEGQICQAARGLVEAYFNLSPTNVRTVPDGKRMYTRLFNGARSQIEYYMERYGLTLEEAAGHQDKKSIGRQAHQFGMTPDMLSKLE